MEKKISEFSITNDKTLSSSPNYQHLDNINRCICCEQNIHELMIYRQKEIVLQYENSNLKVEIEKLNKEKQYLISSWKTIHRQENSSCQVFQKQDLQAELFQAKFIIQLLEMSKMKPESFLAEGITKEKYENLTIENLKLQQQIIVRDKIIKERNLFPLYHYDSRVLMLRNAIQYWYRKAEQSTRKCKHQLKKIKNQMHQIGLNVKKQVQDQKQKILIVIKQLKKKINGKIKIEEKISKQKQQQYQKFKKQPFKLSKMIKK